MVNMMVLTPPYGVLWGSRPPKVTFLNFLDPINGPGSGQNTIIGKFRDFNDLLGPSSKTQKNQTFDPGPPPGNE